MSNKDQPEPSPKHEIGESAKFDVGDEVTTNPGREVLIVKERSWHDGKGRSMWIYRCFKKGDKTESTATHPEHMLKRPGPPPQGRIIVRRPRR